MLGSGVLQQAQRGSEIQMSGKTGRRALWGTELPGTGNLFGCELCPPASSQLPGFGPLSEGWRAPSAPSGCGGLRHEEVLRGWQGRRTLASWLFLFRLLEGHVRALKPSPKAGLAWLKAPEEPVELEEPAGAPRHCTVAVVLQGLQLLLTGSPEHLPCTTA